MNRTKFLKPKNQDPDDFIYINDDALSLEMCVNLYNHVWENKKTFQDYSIKSSTGAPERRKNDQDDYWFWVEYFNTFPENWYEHIVNVVTTEGLKYLKKYPVTFEGREMTSPKIKYHVVNKHQGYHAWHHEHASTTYASSVLSWHLSLTDHNEEGELEFLYYGKRIAPRAGRMIIFPSYFTHCHRGNPVRGDMEKHYLTGWWSEKEVMKL